MRKYIFNLIISLVFAAFILLWPSLLYAMGLGGGGSNSSGDQDPNIQHLMSLEGPRAPVRVAVSQGGNIYVTDTRANRVLIFNRYGNLKRELDHLAQPLGIMVDESGFIYVGENGKGAVSVFDNQGRFVHYLGIGPGQFSMPNDITIDSEGYIYVVDSLEHCIKKFNPAGGFVSQFGTKGSDTGEFNFPVGISYDSLNNRLIITDQNNTRLQAFSLSGTYLSTYTCSNRIEGLTVDPKGRIYVVDVFQGRGQSLNSVGTSLGYFGSFGTGVGQLRLPSDISFHPAGWLIVSSTYTGRLEIYQVLDIPPADILPPPEITPIPDETVFTPFDYLSWGGSYASGVTFTIQLADTADFVNPITLEGITSTKLSLNQLITLLREKGYNLEDNTKYWWRIKAVDAAGRESNWANGNYFIFNIIYLEVNTDPSEISLFADAEINFEGYYIGYTPLTLNYLPAAKFYLRLAHPGYEDLSVLIDLSDGQDRSISAHLKAGLKVKFKQKGKLLRDSLGNPIYLNHPVPLVIDWNNDGVADLLVGEGSGKVILFLADKIGNRISLRPGISISFNGSEQLVEARAAPFVADLNGDFKKDLLVGTASGQVFLFLNEGTDEEPQFYQMSELTAQGNLYLAPANAAPTISDWDNDGWPDLLVGTGDGRVIFYQNLGSSGDRLELAPGRELLYQGESLLLGTDAKPVITDFDRDGRKDLIIGTGEGQLYLFLNSSQEEGEPIFNNKVRLLLPSNGNIFRPGIAPTLAQWDSKPGIDLIAGNSFSEIRLYSGKVKGFVETYLDILKSSIDEINEYIQTLPDEAFNKKPSQRKHALENKLVTVKKMITKSKLQKARTKLIHDLVQKWTPARSTWIIDANAQNDLNSLTDKLLEEMEQALKDAGK